MPLFSERYNYVKPSDALLRECFPEEVANAVCNSFDDLEAHIEYELCEFFNYTSLESFLWVNFFNNRRRDFYGNSPVATSYLLDNRNPWYRKLDLVEATLKYLLVQVQSKKISMVVVDCFVDSLNASFKRLHYAYKVIGQEIVEISSEEEETAIETALDEANDNVKEHLETALSLYAKKPEGDYRNSIKESISAVEAYCREKTGENSLGKALNKLEAKGIVIPNILKVAFDKLYAYTNHPDTGIRHALMDEDGKYLPGQEEALFILVSCSSFLNYLRKKTE